MNFNDKFIITYSKENFTNTSIELKQNCKILKFPPELNFDELLLGITELNSNEYPNLYFFIFESLNIKFCGQNSIQKPEKVEVIEKFLLKFCKNRPIVLQFESKSENLTKLYYKEENVNQFFEINQQAHELENIQHFPTFFSALISQKIKIIDDELIEKLTKSGSSALILRVLRTLELSVDVVNKIIFKCAANGSKNQFIAALDIPFGNESDQLTSKALKYFTDTFNIDSESNDSEQSILLIATENSNLEVIKFLTTNCKHLIQKLPYDHQVDITNAAHSSNQIEVLCDLLDCDFPFPDNFDSGAVNSLRLKKIIDNRERFHQWIEDQNIKSIENFIESNAGFKIIYNIQNDSALYHAMISKKFKVFYYLKSLGFQGVRINSYTEIASDDEELEAVKTSMIIQRRKNISNALENLENSAMIMITKSFIHNQMISDETELEYRQKITKWIKDIYKTRYGCKLIDAAAQCPDLKIIFDFENETADSIDLNAPNSLGVTYPAFKRIFIGAKTTNIKDREQKIKGVIAHELCHYVLRLVYENDEKPYYEVELDKAKKFEEVVSAYKKYGDEQAKLDDECEGILSNVYKNYESNLHHIELIVIGPQIQATYDNAENKVKHLEGKFELLFQFFDKFVLPEIKKFNLRKREDLRTLNKTCEILPEIEKLEIDFLALKCLNIIDQFVIITTNVPKLLLLNIYKNLQGKYRSLVNAKNLFLSPEILKKSINFEDVITKSKPDNVIVDCINEFGDDLKDVIVNKKLNYIFIVTNEDKCHFVQQILQQAGIEVVNISSNYCWNDLNSKSKDNLVETKVNFQGCLSHSLCDVINEVGITEDHDILKNDDFYSDIIDDQLLNLMVNKFEVPLNLKLKDDMNEKDFKLLFQPRTFKKIEFSSQNHCESNVVIATSNLNIFPSATTNLSVDQIVENVKNSQYILISDIAGTGKSWALKNIAEILHRKNSKRWTSIVDLKQFIKVFKSSELIINFAEFIAENILKLEVNYEAKIFTNLYKNGNVNILFDGFDEIAPDCVTIVIQLIKSCKFNNGNQIWIATRDYFEGNLQSTLGIDAVYKLEQFTQEENVKILASNWVLNNRKKDCIIASQTDIFNSLDFKEYQTKANEVSKEILGSDVRSIGFPLLIKMIAVIYADNKTKAMSLTVPKVFTEFIKLQIERWSIEKGEIRKNASISQNVSKTLIHREVHQLFAMKNLFPEIKQFCDLNVEDCDWSDEEIIACGMMNKKGEFFSFLHETFQEYYAADFIVRILIKGRKSDERDMCEYLIIFLTVRNYGVIRMFLNEAIADETVAKKIIQKMPNISKIFRDNIEKLVNLSDIFNENLENLVDIIFSLFKNWKIENIQRIFHINRGLINSILKNCKFFHIFHDFMFNWLNVNDLKNFILDQRIIHKLAGSTIDGEIVAKFIETLELKTDFNFVAKILQSKDELGDNLIFCLIDSSSTNVLQIQIFLSILNQYLKKKAVMDLMQESNVNEWKIFHACIAQENKAKLEFLWTEVKAFFASQNELHKFKELLIHKSKVNQTTILHISSFCKNLDFHQTLWKLLLTEFENREELKELTIQKTKNDETFIHNLVINNESNVINYIFTILKENLNQTQYHEVLNIKGMYKRSLFQIAAKDSKDIKIHQVLWRTLRNSCKNPDEFLEILGEVDEDYCNVFQIAAYYTTSEIFEFMIEELEKVASLDQIKTILSNLDFKKQHILQTAAKFNKFLELHETLWKVLKKTFKPSEILEFIKHFDSYGKTTLLHATIENTKDVVELTWKQMSEVIINNNFLEEVEKPGFKKCDDTIKNILQSQGVREEEKEVLEMRWIKDKNEESSKLFKSKSSSINEQKLTVKNLDDLRLFTSDDNLQNHEILWKHLIKNYNNSEDLLKLLLEPDRENNSYIHLLIGCNKPEVIEFTLNKLKENLNTSQFKELLRSKGMCKRNMLLRVAGLAKDLRIHQLLFHIIKSSLGFPSELLQFMTEVDEDGSNIYSVTALFAKSDVFEFIHEELEKITTHEEIRKMLSNTDIWKRNLLQSAVNQNTFTDLHESLWRVIRKYFNSSEILQFIKHIEAFDKNLLLLAILENTIGIVELIWKEIVQTINENCVLNEEQAESFKKCEAIVSNVLQSHGIRVEEREILKFTWIENKDPEACKLFDRNLKLIDEESLSIKSLNDIGKFATDQEIQNHETLWRYLLKTFENRIQLFNLLSEVDRDNDNYIHLLIIFNKSDVIEFTIKMFKENLSSSQYQEILKSHGMFKRNLLQKAVRDSKELKLHQLLWKTFQEACKSKEEFLEILGEINEFGSNIIDVAVSFTSVEIFNFMIEELEKTASNEDIKKLFNNIDFEKQNFLQAANVRNKFFEFHENLWKFIPKYFNLSEMIDLINHCDKDGFHLFHISVYYNTKNIADLTWREIQKVIVKNEDQKEYLNRVGLKNKNLLQLSLENKTKDAEIRGYVKNLMNNYEIL